MKPGPPTGSVLIDTVAMPLVLSASVGVSTNVSPFQLVGVTSSTTAGEQGPVAVSSSLSRQKALIST